MDLNTLLDVSSIDPVHELQIIIWLHRLGMAKCQRPVAKWSDERFPDIYDLITVLHQLSCPILIAVHEDVADAIW